MIKERLSSGLEILKPEEGYLLYKKNEDPVTYHEIVYLAKMDSESDYAEVTVDYVYGKDYDGQIEELKSALKEQQKTLDEYAIIISSQSDMIDYLLFFDTDAMMNMLSSRNNIKDTGINSMAIYLARRILQNKLSYRLVMSKFIDLKKDIDFILIEEGGEDLIEEC